MIDLNLPPTPGAVPDARTALESLGQEVSPQTFEDLRLLVSELVTNSVRHGGLGGSQTIHLRVKLSGDTVRVEVNDHGGGFEPSPRTAQSQDESGWGLYLVSRLADRWGVTSDGVTQVWFELERNRT
ncbi:MAG: ATP-binding protein [Actinobacteria bacterium]|nr:ATP-binding protein [Actinomycetota bacterium]